MPERFTFFYTKASPFSQFHPSEFTNGELCFSCAEQWMMYQKAVLFGDSEVAEKILKADAPPKMKALGRKVKGFNDDIWKENRCDIVYEGNLLKFRQNESLRSALLSTAGTTLVEASRSDNIWGIGLSEDDPRAQSRETWRGLNLLGEQLNRVRETILAESQ